jgi:hypothetical protein
LRLVREGFVAACGRRDVPFEQIAWHLEQHAGVSRQDLAQTFFLFHEDGPALPPLVGSAIESAPIDASAGFFKSAAHDYDLIVFLARHVDGGIRGQITLKGARSDRAVGSELVATYQELLAELVRESEDGAASRV